MTDELPVMDDAWATKAEDINRRLENVVTELIEHAGPVALVILAPIHGVSVRLTMVKRETMEQKLNG